MESKQSSNLINKVACKILHKGPVDKQAIADEPNDLSYEDALLDVQLTSFFRSEYAKQEPPSGVFPRIIQAICLNRERQERLTSASLFTRLADMVGHKLAAAYRFGARADSGRVLSGGLVTALLLIAAWPSLSGALSTNKAGTIFDTYFQAFSNNGEVRPTQSPEGLTVAPLQATPRTASPETKGQSAIPTGPYVSPGRLYEDSVLRTEQRTGEDLKASENNGRADNTPPSSDKTQVAEPQDEQQYQRPVLGQD